MKKNKKIFILTILVVFIIFATPILSSAGGDTSQYFGVDSGTDPINNPGYYNPGAAGSEDIVALTDKIGPIYPIISTIGIIVATIVLIILGIKYMVGSVEERAEYKKSMLPYIIGSFMLIGIITILGIISTFTSSISSRL